MGDLLDMTHGPVVQPVFVSCDPARDTVEQVKRYVGGTLRTFDSYTWPTSDTVLADFHPRLVGLTGSWQAVKAACKVYRVYFSTPPDASADDDYLVDHSIFFYLMSPKGEFVDAFGKSHTPEEVQKKVTDSINEWKAAGNKP